MSDALASLRRHAVRHTLFAATDLVGAIRRLGFVQADPIRAPARAQDLILRHRVIDYRAGDLEHLYPSLPVAEDVLHVYGFLPRERLALLHPRRVERVKHVEREHARLRSAVLAHLRESGASHPRALELALAPRHPKSVVVNGWGGLSSATTRMLEALHYRGHLHVVRRETGIKIYDLATAHHPRQSALRPAARAEGLVRLLVGLYAPMPAASLAKTVAMLGERAPSGIDLRDVIARQLRRGELIARKVDGIDYVWPADSPHDDALPVEDGVVRLIAPFDPLVWDRRRFEHLWGWDYRFEAYTPAAKRRFGYYALPLLWLADDDARLVGWANVAQRPPRSGTRSGGRLAVEVGYIGKRPRGPAFKAALDAEIARLERFLQPRTDDANAAGEVR